MNNNEDLDNIEYPLRIRIQTEFCVKTVDFAWDEYGVIVSFDKPENVTEEWIDDVLCSICHRLMKEHRLRYDEMNINDGRIHVDLSYIEKIPCKKEHGYIPVYGSQEYLNMKSYEKSYRELWNMALRFSKKTESVEVRQIFLSRAEEYRTLARSLRKRLIHSEIDARKNVTATAKHTVQQMDPPKKAWTTTQSQQIQVPEFNSEEYQLLKQLSEVHRKAAISFIDAMCVCSVPDQYVWLREQYEIERQNIMVLDNVVLKSNIQYCATFDFVYLESVSTE